MLSPVFIHAIELHTMYVRKDTNWLFHVFHQPSTFIFATHIIHHIVILAVIG